MISAILLHILAVRPVHEHNTSMGGVMPQVTVISKVAMSDQCHDGIMLWHSSQVEGLVTHKVVQVQVLSPAVKQHKDLRQSDASPSFLSRSFLGTNWGQR
jgi:hypothetical protein